MLILVLIYVFHVSPYSHTGIDINVYYYGHENVANVKVLNFRWKILLIDNLHIRKTYFFNKRRICVSETVGNTALIFATCDSESEFWVKLVSVFLTGVGDSKVKSPNRVVTALVDFSDSGVFSSYTYTRF